MQRTNKVEKEEQVDKQLLKWRNSGGGTFRMAGGKIIKPNQVYKAYEDQVPAAFRDTQICLEEIPTEVKVIPKKSKNATPKYEIVHKGAGWYDVIDSSGKPVNEKALREAEAITIKSELEE
jgi:hypothetical protein